MKESLNTDRLLFFLICMVLMQTLLLAGIYFESESPPENQPVVNLPHPSEPAPEMTNHPGLDSTEMRRIVREELARISLKSESAAASEPEATHDDDRAYPHRYDEVITYMDHLRGTGPVPREDMIKLEMMIMQLDHAGRREMLSRLALAINSGEIEGLL